jgi:D-alanine-D-alanine ligase
MAEQLTPPGPWRIAVLSGGDSDERDISLQSGEAVWQSLRARGHDVTLIDPAGSSSWRSDVSRWDAVFLALHGRSGEDGDIQQQLEALGVPYSGSDPLASRLAFSKSAAKERFAACGVPTPPARLVHVDEPPARHQDAAKQIGYPLVVKPDSSGSSLGVSLVRRPDQLHRALRDCFARGPHGLMEQAVLGGEWTLGLLDREPLPLIRIDTPRAFFDFTAKYEDDATVYDCEPQIPESLQRLIAATGLAAARAVNTRGIARVDLRLDEQQRPWVLEVNTIPGFTDHSLVPKAALRRGWSLGELCERSLQSAISSHRSTQHDPHNPMPQHDSRRPADLGSLRYAS